MNKFTQTYLKIITQGTIGDAPFPHTGKGLDSFPNADPKVISQILTQLKRSEWANNQQILNIIASDYWVRLDYRKYINNNNFDDLKSTVAGVCYKHMNEFDNLIKVDNDDITKKMEDVVTWFKSTYYQNDPSFKWKVRQGNDIRPYSIYLEWNDSGRENTYMNGIQLINGHEINNGTGPVSSTIHAFAQKVWRDTKCKNFEIFIRITGE